MKWKSVLLPAAMIVVAAAIILPTSTTLDGRVLQHLLSLMIQILTAGTAAVLVWGTARGFEVQDRERRTWHRIGLSVLLWTAGLLLYAATEWLGHRPSFPSAADLFFVASFLTLGTALGHEFRFAYPVLTHRQRIVLGVGAIGLWALLIRFLWPILASPLAPVERMLDVFYSAVPALLLALGLGPVMASRSQGAAYTWMALAAGACCLALASLGFAYLHWFDLYADVHPVNLLRVAGFAFIIAGGTWRRTAGSTATSVEAVRDYVSAGVGRWRSVWSRGSDRSRRRAPGQDIPRAHPDVPLLVSLGIGIVSGTVIVLLGAGVWSRRHSSSLPVRSPGPVARQTTSAQATPASVATGPLLTSNPSPDPSRTSLREAQDEFLGILLRTPDDQRAIHGLVVVRRRMAGDDPVKLRRQAAAYTDAIAKRTETEEHYTNEAMALLARTCLLAASEIEAERAKKP